MNKGISKPENVVLIVRITGFVELKVKLYELKLARQKLNRPIPRWSPPSYSDWSKLVYSSLPWQLQSRGFSYFGIWPLDQRSLAPGCRESNILIINEQMSKERSRSYVLVAIIASKPIVDIQNVVVVLVVISIIMSGFTRFGENTSRVVGWFITKLRVTYMICIQNVGG